MIEAAQIPKILIAGVGNELRQDDAFGLLLTRELLKNKRKHPNLMIQEFGIGGIHLVQELHNQYDILIILDAVSWGGKAGDIYWRSATTEDINELPKAEKRNFLADMHYTNPVRALMLAKAINVLPAEVYILGCEALTTEGFEMGVSDEVKQAIPKALEQVNKWLDNKIGSFNYQDKN